MAELMVALRRYQAETGRPAERLEQLEPKYLEEIPADPFGGASLRYRLSKGEEIMWPGDGQNLVGAGAGAPIPPGAPGGFGNFGGPATRTIPAGQGILWSVGEDRQDDDAKRQGLLNRAEETHPGEDLIYLVPLPASKRPVGN
jgi:hypothetical protein